MQRTDGMPPMIPADDRRVMGWRVLREYLAAREGHPFLRISSECKNLIESLPALICDPVKAEDASGTPHSITHSPEALRYGIMSRISMEYGSNANKNKLLLGDFNVFYLLFLDIFFHTTQHHFFYRAFKYKRSEFAVLVSV